MTRDLASVRALAFIALAAGGCVVVPRNGPGIASEAAAELFAEAQQAGPEAPDRAWEQDFFATRDPALGYPPRERLLPIYERLRSAGPNRSSGVGFVWQPRGPYDVGGRTRAVMFDPNDPTGRKVWAGGVSGGLWTIPDITSPTAFWTAVDDFWNSLWVTAIAHDPTNTQVFYVGTGEGWAVASSNGTPGLGVFKSTDGGATWQPLPASLPFAYVNDLVVRVEGGQGVLYVAVDATSYGGQPSNNNQGLYRSDDGGATFDQVLPNITGSPYAPADIEVGPGNRLHVGTLRNPAGNGGGTALYSDNGTTWTAVSLVAAGRRVELAVAPSDPNRLYALVEGNLQLNSVRRSTNGGVSWTAAPAQLPMAFANFQAWYDLILVVDPTDPNIVFAGAVQLQRTMDGMASWKQIQTVAHSDYHALAYRPGSSSELVLGTDGGVYYLTSAQAQFPSAFKRNDAYIVTQFYACAMKPGAGVDYFLAGAQDNGTRKFQGPGIVATQQAIVGDGAFCFVNQQNPSVQIGSQILNAYFRSLNGGQTFTALPNLGGGLFINPADYDPNQDVLYSSLNGTSIHRISGVSGTPQASALNVPIGSGFGTYASALTVSPHTTASSTLFVGTQVGRVFRIEHAETNSAAMTEITAPGFPAGNVSRIEVGATEDELKLTFSNYGVTSIWHTSDGGDQWTAKEGNLPDMPVRWLVSNPANADDVLLATEVGVWRTLDFSSASPDWQPANTGLANVRTDMLQVRASDRLVIAATHGRGLFSSMSFNGPLAGEVPNDALTVARTGDGDLTLSWSPSCTASDTDYEIYEGQIGNFTSHSDVLCSTGGSTTQTLTPGPGDTYYLVVPRNAAVEGSYGVDSEGVERLPGTSSCLPYLIGGCE